MDNLGGTDGGQVAVALVGEHGLIGMGALDAGGNGGSAAMGGLHHVTGEVFVGKHGAAHGTDADGAVQQSQLHQGFRHQLVDDAVMAAGAVMQFLVGQSSGLLIYDRHIT